MSLLETLLGPTRKLPALSKVPKQLSQLLFSDLGIRECPWKGTLQLIAISSSLGSEDSTAERVKGLVHSKRQNQHGSQVFHAGLAPSKLHYILATTGRTPQSINVSYIASMLKPLRNIGIMF